MKVFLSESTIDYGTYTFSYAPYALREGAEDLSPIYNQGFLPYSGDLTLEKELFYMARSLRVDLERFVDSSENRRVSRLMEPLGVEMELINKNDFDLNDPDFRAFCENYVSERIGDGNMNAERLEYILASKVGTHIFKFSNKEKTMGYILAAVGSDMLHYWFAFFDIEYMKSHSLGKWMMWKTIVWAKENGLKNVYLGTAYKTAALYKIRDHKGLSFWDGQKWNQDVKLLKALCKVDTEPKEKDSFKQLEDRNDFLDSL
ncbi:GNAT family N-acetyltransferase [Marinilongibacter aquaticus]|uniref:GNAT family N-acetyltransferase n=1 Tax=Marinilongibacter aquaticus TaxID=2975157 RepID=UPI0021BD4AC0|nr:GNAT family N-acetyltransferase [Marinilongibacter aquaticus]UBM57252.1 GNAT family N-acetyltransferase [Marinilongibacter aquaticus]